MILDLRVILTFEAFEDFFRDFNIFHLVLSCVVISVKPILIYQKVNDSALNDFG